MKAFEICLCYSSFLNDKKKKQNILSWLRKENRGKNTNFEKQQICIFKILSKNKKKNKQEFLCMWALFFLKSISHTIPSWASMPGWVGPWGWAIRLSLILWRVVRRRVLIVLSLVTGWKKKINSILKAWIYITSIRINTVYPFHLKISVEYKYSTNSAIFLHSLNPVLSKAQLSLSQRKGN